MFLFCNVNLPSSATPDSTPKFYFRLSNIEKGLLETSNNETNGGDQ